MILKAAHNPTVWPRHRPVVYPGMRIGVLGGSFNPAHDGHLHISSLAIKQLRLHQIWWLVSPQNPLKSTAGMAAFAKRYASAQKLAIDPRIEISDLELQFGTRYTAETLRCIVSRYPGGRFVWLMGADNFLQIPHWQDWQAIFHTMPIGIFARAPFETRARLCKAAQRFWDARIDPSDADLLPTLKAPAWMFVAGQLHPQSSTALRKKGAA
ncbi:MAG: nicotinate-nucleotide adenylyltransferase [Pseudomonadota bacterium]